MQAIRESLQGHNIVVIDNTVQSREGIDKSSSELDSLSLDSARIGDEDIDTLVKRDYPALKHLSKDPTRLKKLYLSFKNIGDQIASKIASNCSWVNLEEIDLSGNGISANCAEKIGKNPAWKHLRVLNLSYNRINDAGAIMIVRNNTWNELEELYLSTTGIGNKTANWIGCNISWRKLKKLDLSQNEITDEGAQSLMKNRLGLAFELDLSENNLSDETFTKTLDSTL